MQPCLPKSQAELQVTCDLLEAQKQDLEAKLHTCQQRNKEQAAESEKLQQQICDESQKIADAIAINTELRSDLADAQERCVQVEDKNKALHGQRDTQKEAFRRMQDQMHEQESRRQEWEAARDLHNKVRQHTAPSAWAFHNPWA